MNEVYAAKIDAMAKTTAMGTFLSSEHNTNEYENVLAILRQDECTKLGNGDEIILWQLVENESPRQVGQYIADEYSVAHSNLVWAFEQGQQFNAEMNMTVKQMSVIKCAYADLVGSYECEGVGNTYSHDWSAHMETIREIEETFSFVEPVTDGSENHDTEDRNPNRNGVQSCKHK